MTLRRYRQKRRFTETPEPEGGHPEGQAPIFVVQLHHASRRHYDFRLQVGGVLKSWAVPKGPSFDPAVKRLAMEVEDHPLDYAHFEGVIPAGNYGAGEVRIFDHGTWSSEHEVRRQLGRGHLHFRLNGDKLRGEWDLVRTGHERGRSRWILRKAGDDEAGPFEADDLLGDPDEHAPRLPLPGARPATIDDHFFAPELARRRDAPPTGEAWIHEPKWDGYRLLAAVAEGKPRLWSRNAIEWTARLPHVVSAIAALGARSLRLDGELVAITGGQRRARGDFNALQAALSDKGSDTALRYVVFDVIHVEGVDLSGCALVDRKRVLSALLERSDDPVLIEGHYARGDAKALLARAVQQGQEGLVSKRADSLYRAGRGDDWIKVRAREAEELAVVGYTEPRGSRAGIGALLMGRPLPEGGWAYAGRVGTGMGQALLRELHAQLAPLERETAPVRRETLTGSLRGVHWVEPRLAVEVEHSGIGNGGLLRQPSVKGVRKDKRTSDLRSGGDEVPDVRLSSGERVVYPEVGITKAEVFAYYQAVAALMLEEIARRPLAVVRCPNGVTGQAFFQKHHRPGFGPHVLGAQIISSEGETQSHLYIEEVAGLLELAQMNVIEVHTWGTHVDDPELCDRLIFDLDPAEDVPWRRVVEAAQLARRALATAGLTAFPRLTGGKGIHIVAPLSPAAPWDEVKAFARELTRALVATRPDELIDVATKRKRAGLIFIDYLRNARGATAIASYSLRRDVGASVAWPLDWKELGRTRSSKAYTLRSALRALRRRRRDPWARLASTKQALPRIT